MHEEFSASDEAHDKEYLLFSLEDVVHADQEWVVCLHKDLLLQLGRLYLVIVENDIFAKRLHCVYFFRVLLFNQEHFPKTASSNNFLNQKVLQSHFLVACFCVQCL